MEQLEFDVNISHQIQDGTAYRFCPNYCKCDLYEGRNRADCSATRLINPYVELSNAVEILDLSYNDIAIIDNDCFKEYHYLINLTIAHNDVHTIYLDAFIRLYRLKAIDLSYNRLEYLDERLFEANRHLKLLNLEGNKFMTLPKRPFLRSTSLRTLNLRNAKIVYIEPDMLNALPQLTELDLSQNLMITLNAASFYATKHLKYLQLNENAWKCDDAMVKALSIIRHRGVNTTIPECDVEYHEWRKQLPLRVDNSSSSSSKKSRHDYETMPMMYERMRVMEKVTTQNHDSNTDVDALDVDDKTLEHTKTLNWRNLSTYNDEDNNDNVSNSHEVNRFNSNTAGAAAAVDDVAHNTNDNDDDDDDDDDFVNFFNMIGETQKPRSRLSLLGIKVDEKLCDGTRENLCRRYRDCLGQVSHFMIKQMEKLSETAETSSYTRTDMTLAFMFGVAIGIAFVVFFIACVLLIRGLCDKLRKPKTIDGLEDIYATLPYTAHAMEVPIPAPTVSFPTRRSRRPRRQPVRIPVDHEIVQREQGADSFIARLLGRPARQHYYQARATLIRSLSRTSLFNGNSQRQQRSSPNETTTPNVESTPLNNNQQNRPETPPPNYGDLVIKK